MIPIIPYSYYYWVGGPPNAYPTSFICGCVDKVQLGKMTRSRPTYLENPHKPNFLSHKKP